MCGGTNKTRISYAKRSSVSYCLVVSSSCRESTGALSLLLNRYSPKKLMCSHPTGELCFPKKIAKGKAMNTFTK
jgi:hypothetical protein